MASEETQTSQTAEEQKTFTQEEVDALIKKRLARVKSDVPADYEELKSKAQKFDELEEANKTELQKATAPKLGYRHNELGSGLIISQNATAPKLEKSPIIARTRFDYQSKCHCSKTKRQRQKKHAVFDYQSKCHCSKTR